jgi:hypothetical protein
LDGKIEEKLILKNEKLKLIDKLKDLNDEKIEEKKLALKEIDKELDEYRKDLEKEIKTNENEKIKNTEHRLKLHKD